MYLKKYSVLKILISLLSMKMNKRLEKLKLQNKNLTHFFK